MSFTLDQEREVFRAYHRLSDAAAQLAAVMADVRKPTPNAAAQDALKDGVADGLEAAQSGIRRALAALETEIDQIERTAA